MAKEQMDGFPLALDHLTVTDATPVQLVALASAARCRAVCVFMQSMDVLPRMPPFDLYGDPAARRELKACMDDAGVGLDIAYPFTLAGRTQIQDLRPAIDCAAFLGARAVNVLAYDREPARRLEKFAAFCDLAHGNGLGVVVEFFPMSQVRTLGEALALVQAVRRPGEVGVNVDLLHLVRSGGSVADVASAPADMISYAQHCDGPAHTGPDRLDFEASFQRLLPGAGVFDLAGFARALPPGCPMSVELPQDEAIAAGVLMTERARRAVEGVRAAIS